MKKDGVDPDDKRARLRGKRVVLSVLVVAACLFVGLSAAQIIQAVFGAGIQPLAPSGERGVHQQACVEGIRTLTEALDRAAARAVGVRAAATEWAEKQAIVDDSLAIAAFNTGLSPEWDSENAVQERCGHDPQGTDAFAALLRLRLAEEQFVRRQVVEIAPLRRDVAAYLPH